MAFIEFENITQQANIDDVGESWGTAFGDINGDGWVDIWLNNHLGVSKLYLNQKDGTFVDGLGTTLVDFRREDNHGAAWADFDNDGDQDLIQLNGAGGGKREVPNFLYVNEGGRLIEKAADFNLDYPKGRGRMPLWFDQNRDGKLDLFIGVADRPDRQAPPTLFHQTQRGFNDIGTQLGLFQEDGVVAQLSYLSNGLVPELAVIGKERVIFDTRSQPLVPVTSELGLTSLKGTDFVFADLNNDLRPDIFQTRFQNRSDVFQDTENGFKAFFQKQGNSSLEQGVDFRTTAKVTFEIPTFNPTQIFIGQTGFNPRSTNFRLNTSDADNVGLKSRQVGQDPGLYIGYDPEAQRWKLRWSNSEKNEVFARVTSQQAIESLAPLNFNPSNALNTDRLWLNTPSGFQAPQAANQNILSAGRSVTAGDFDNDMDLDLYVVSATKVGNPSNLFYENQGDGTFNVVNDAAGAAGTSLGVGSAAASADINNDGFLDLLVMNGGSFLGNGRSILDDGPTELFLNQGNQNHWIAITLQGRYSNRDGIGSRVLLTSGGKTQLREQNGGTQSQVQNHTRLHFGLGQNPTVDQILVKWTNGLSQTLSNLDSRQFLKITEGMGHQGDDILEGTRRAEILRGLGGNDQLRGGGANDTLVGELGDDTLEGDGGDDVLRGGAGADHLFGRAGRDELRGQGGNDKLFGGDSADQLLGNEGNDWLFGDRGQDSLHGGSGADSFQLNPINRGVVTLQDFQSGVDRIIISRSVAQNSLVRGRLPNRRLVSDSRVLGVVDGFVYDSAKGYLFWDADGAGSLAPVLMAKLGRNTPLRANDIQII